MTRGDRIQDLQESLDELQPELEKLFEKILYNLDKRCLKHASQYFRLIETDSMPPGILEFAYADEETVPTATSLNEQIWQDKAISQRVHAMSRRLNSRCKGFLEVNRFSPNQDGIEIFGRRFGPTVQYLHRTVRDFIKSPRAQEFLRLSTDPTFDPSLQLCIASFLEFRTITLASTTRLTTD